VENYPLLCLVHAVYRNTTKFDLPQAKYRLFTLPRAYAAYSGISLLSFQFNRAQVLLDRGADAAGKIRGKILSLRPKNCFQNTDTCVNL
jgi:hypothetical protein